MRVRPANELERGKPNLVNIVDDNCIVFDPHDASMTSLQSKESFLGATGQAATRVGATAG